MYSPTWSAGPVDLAVESGQTLVVTGNTSGSWVSIRDGVSAKIVRSDIALENGVLHVS